MKIVLRIILLAVALCVSSCSKDSVENQQVREAERLTFERLIEKFTSGGAFNATEILGNVEGNKAGYTLKEIKTLNPTGIASVQGSSLKFIKNGNFTVTLVLQHANKEDATIYKAPFGIIKGSPENLTFSGLTEGFVSGGAFNATEILGNVKGNKAGYTLKEIKTLNPTGIASVQGSSLKFIKSGNFTVTLVLGHANKEDVTIYKAPFSITQTGILDGFISDIGAGGLAMAYLRKGKLVKEVVGTSAKGKSLRTDMLFSVASNTKIFTASLIMMLHEEGKIKLDDTIEDHLDLSPYSPSKVNPKVTIKQLLNHHSGLAKYATDPIIRPILAAVTGIGPVASPYTSLQLLNAIGNYTTAGTKGYRNTNYLILGLIIEKLTGKKYHTFLREKILNPHGLKDSYLAGKETYPTDKLAHSWFTVDGTNYIDVGGIDRKASESLGWAAGSLMTTLDDMVKFYRLLFVEKKIVTDASLKKIMTIHPGSIYGFGIQKHAIDGKSYYDHGGLSLAYESRMVFDPDSQGIIAIFKNSAGLNQKNKLFTEIIRKVFLHWD